MVFELHTWGPAFGLPSIDPECLAAIAYLDTCLHPDEWILSPDSDPDVCPFGELPAFRDGDTWISGFKSIVGYLESLPNEQWALDRHLSARQGADRTAYITFVESRGAPLLDLSLFVSSENYTNVTRSMIGGMLTWPNSWTIPGRVREKAKKRSEHLGLDGLDVDAAAEEQEAKKREDGGLSGQIPKGLKRDRTTLTGMLGKGVRGNQFRLAGVTDDFLEPMQELLGENKWLLGTDGPSSLDCLAVGYLALMMRADVPHAWLKTALEEKYHRLGNWVDRAVTELFGESARQGTADGLPEKGTKYSTLPWRTPAKRTWIEVGSAMLQSLTGSLPIIGPAYLHPELKTTSNGNRTDIYKNKQVALVGLKDRQLFYSQVVASCLGIATALGLLFWTGLWRPPTRLAKNARRDFGAAGAMLGLG